MSTDAPAARFKILPEVFRGKRIQAVVIGVLALLSTGATLLLPWAVGQLLGDIAAGQPLGIWTWVLVGTGLGAALANATATFLLSRLGQQLICRLRIRSMRHGLGLRLLEARRQGTGNIAVRLTADSAAVKGVIDIGPIQLPMAVITLIGTLVIMGVLDWVLLLITLGSFLVALAIIAMVVMALRRKYVAIQNEVGSLAEHFVAAMEALTVIKTCRAEGPVAAGLSDRARRIAGIEVSAARQEALMVPVINLGQQIALVAVILGGGARVISGELTLAVFVAFLLYLLQLAAPLLMAVTGVSGIQVGLMARKRFDELFSLPTEQGPSADRVGELPANGRAGTPAVRFDGVTFSYDQEPVLRGVNLEVAARGLTAMVGPSGAGKTTVLGLIERLMEPDGGRIEVFGREASDWPLSQLRGRLAYVDQACTLLRESVRGNLTLGLTREVTDRELFGALERVGLAEDIAQLPDGLDTVLGGAADLSGGQRQRLALARAILADARLVLLDEPSSQLDSVNEHRLRETIDELARDRAVLVVAHRLSTVQHADQVIVLDSGQVAARGRHEDLLAGSSQYAELVNGQILDTPALALAGQSAGS